MAKSLPPVSTKLIADAEQFIAEFKRAERAAQQGTSKVGVEVDKMARNLSKKFSLGDVGKDLLKGFGLGSGFAVAQQAADMLVEQFERAAQAAQDMEASTAATFATLDQQLAKRRTPEQELNKLLKDQARLYAEIAELQKPRTELVPVGGNLNMRWESRSVAPGADQIARVQAITTELQKLDDAINPARAKVVDNALADFFGELDAAAAKLTGTREAAAKASEQATAAAERESDTLAATAARYLEMIDPTKRFADQLEEIETLFWAGHLSAEAAAASIDKVHEAMANDEARRVDSALKDFFKPLEEVQDDLDAKAKLATDSARELGWAFQSSFEDAILEGEKLSDVLDGLVQDILRIALRSSVTAPLGEWIGGIFSGKSSPLGGIFGALGGLFKAEGGPVSAGRPYIVGERGPEMIVPRSSGTVIPNHALGAGGGGSTYIIDARGADRTGLARLESMIRSVNGSIEQRALGAVLDHRRRGAFA